MFTKPGISELLNKLTVHSLALSPTFNIIYMRKFFLQAFILLGFSAVAQIKADDVKTFTLKNGMKFLVVEDNSIPNANMYLFYKVGSRNEYNGITGLSHFFEHMMFNGAKKYGPKEFDRTMEFNGGANNAYTRNDVTVYTNWFPASATEVIFGFREPAGTAAAIPTRDNSIRLFARVLRWLSR